MCKMKPKVFQGNQLLPSSEKFKKLHTCPRHLEQTGEELGQRLTLRIYTVKSVEIVYSLGRKQRPFLAQLIIDTFSQKLKVGHKFMRRKYVVTIHVHIFSQSDQTLSFFKTKTTNQETGAISGPMNHRQQKELKIGHKFMGRKYVVTMYIQQEQKPHVSFSDR